MNEPEFLSYNDAKSFLTNFINSFGQIANNGRLSIEDAESVFSVLTSPDMYFVKSITNVFDKLVKFEGQNAKGGYISKRIEFYAENEGRYVISISGYTNGRLMKPSGSWRIHDVDESEQPTGVKIALNIHFPGGDREESIAIGQNNELIFIGSKYSTYLDSPEKLRGNYSMMHVTPWYTFEKIVRHNIVSMLAEAIEA